MVLSNATGGIKRIFIARAEAMPIGSGQPLNKNVNRVRICNDGSVFAIVRRTERHFAQYTTFPPRLPIA
jgi:hypothetical protein